VLSKVEWDPGVDAALPEVAIQGGGAVVVSAQQRAQLAQVKAQLVDGDGGVLPALRCLALALDPGGGSQAGLPDGPDPLLVRRFGQDPDVQDCGPLLHPGGLAGSVERLVGGVAPELDQQDGLTSGQLFAGAAHQVLLPEVLQQAAIDPLEGDRVVPEQLRDLVGGVKDVRVAEDQQGAVAGPADQPDGGLGGW
jgi:hypothetical protein